MSSEQITVTTSINVTHERISDLMCNSIESGYSSYWMGELNIKEESFIDTYEASHNSDVTDPIYRQDIPMLGGTLVAETVEDDDQEYIKFELNAPRCLETLQLMARDYSHHFEDWREENDDAITSDVFLQLAFMGEIVFG